MANDPVVHIRPLVLLHRGKERLEGLNRLVRPLDIGFGDGQVVRRLLVTSTDLLPLCRRAFLQEGDGVVEVADFSLDGCQEVLKGLGAHQDDLFLGRSG